MIDDVPLQLRPFEVYVLSLDDSCMIGETLISTHTNNGTCKIYRSEIDTAYRTIEKQIADMRYTINDLEYTLISLLTKNICDIPENIQNNTKQSFDNLESQVTKLKCELELLENQKKSRYYAGGGLISSVGYWTFLIHV
jgi:hypothetical protein